MAKVGRRPGNADTRAEIVAAAHACFAEDGFEGVSLRAVARRAGVDPALVHHYFDGKAELFMAVMHIGRDPGEIFEEVHTATRKGDALVRAFLREWEPGAAGPSPFVSTVQAVCSSPGAGRALREFLTERVWERARADGTASGARLRQSLVTSQLWGVAMARYILRIEPLASASLDEIGEWVGPLLQRAIDGWAPTPPD